MARRADILCVFSHRMRPPVDIATHDLYRYYRDRYHRHNVHITSLLHQRIHRRFAQPAAQLSNGERDAVFIQLLQVAEMFQYFIERDDGYLKVKRELDGDEVHFTWIWTMGPWTRHYVYVRFPYYQAGMALDLLSQKIAQVNSGLRHPTPDRYGR